MKNLFLLMVAVVIATTAGAQVTISSSPGSVTLPAGGLQPVEPSRAAQIYANSPTQRSHAFGAGKSTSSCCGPYHAWYDLWTQNTNVSGGSLVAPAVEYYFAIYPDSNVHDNYGTSNVNVPWHGMGMSFDPTDSGYYLAPYGYALYNGVVDDITGGTDLMPLSGVAYTIDSFYMPCRYLRNNPTSTVVDSLVIEIVVTRYPGGTPPTDSGAYTLQFTTASSGFYPISYDEKPRFGTIRYNPGGAWDAPPYNAAPYVNDCYFDSVFTYKQRYVIPLTGAATDTDANGNVNLNAAAHLQILPLSPAINIYSSRVHAVSYVSFKSGVNYPLGTLASVANLIHCYAGEPNGSATWFRQNTSNTAVTPSYPGSYQAGVYANNQVRYLHTGTVDTGWRATGQDHDILIPSVAFTAPGLSVPVCAWHINWAGIPVDALGLNSVNKTISSASAYPNPAYDELNVSFTLAQNANVTVTLINLVGQTVGTRTMGNVSTGNAVFSTAHLADGVYMYTVEANGERTTGRVAVQH